LSTFDINEDVPNWKRKRRASNQSRCRRRSRPTEREREPTGIALPCQLERTHVHVHDWHFDGIACCHALKAWDIYHTQQNDIPLNVHGRRMREWVVNSKPWFLAAKFIEAAEVLKTELIQLPADAEIEEDDMLFPPICLARLNRGRNVVAAAPQGRPRRNRINGVVRRCGNCNRPGHIRSKCRFNSV